MKWVAATADRLRPHPSGVVRPRSSIGSAADSGLELDLPVDRFRAQMEWLADQGLLASLDDGARRARRRRSTGAPEPRRRHLRRRHRRLRRPRDARARRRCGSPSRCTWPPRSSTAACRCPTARRRCPGRACATRRRPGSSRSGRTRTRHALLDRLAPAGIADELDTSRRLIEDELGIVPAHFAYPKALPGSQPAEAAGPRAVPVRRAGRAPAPTGTAARTRTAWPGRRCRRPTA